MPAMHATDEQLRESIVNARGAVMGLEYLTLIMTAYMIH